MPAKIAPPDLDLLVDHFADLRQIARVDFRLRATVLRAATVLDLMVRGITRADLNGNPTTLAYLDDLLTDAGIPRSTLDRQTALDLAHDLSVAAEIDDDDTARHAAVSDLAAELVRAIAE